MVHTSLIAMCGFSSCAGACGIFLDQGSNSLPLHCKADFFFFPPSQRERSVFSLTSYFLKSNTLSGSRHPVEDAWGSEFPRRLGGQPCPSASSRTMQRSFGRRHFGPVHVSGLFLRRESEFLSAEQKNGIHKHTDIHGSKRTGFIKEEESTMLPA